jgi:phage terminase small subunit
MTRLNHRQQRFCDNVVKHPDKSWGECAILSGYSAHRSEITASELMSNELVQEEISKQKTTVLQEYSFSYERYLDDLYDMRERAKANENIDLEHRIHRTIGEASGVFVKQIAMKRIASPDLKDLSEREIDQKLNTLLEQMGVELTPREEVKLLNGKKKTY